MNVVYEDMADGFGLCKEKINKRALPSDFLWGHQVQ